MGGGGGAMMSCVRLSGSDREKRESNRLRVSREAVVSNSDVEKLGIPHFKHSHTMFLHEDLLRILYLVDDTQSTPCIMVGAGTKEGAECYMYVPSLFFARRA